MTTLVSSTNLVFLNGRRYRPGEAFELPDGIRLAPGMKRLTPSVKQGELSTPSSPKRARQSDNTNASKKLKRKGAPDQGA